MASRVLPLPRNPTQPPARQRPARCVRAAPACTIGLSPPQRVDVQTRRLPRRSGGIGRRAWFRSVYPQGCGGSSPFFGTSDRRKSSGHPELSCFWPRVALTLLTAALFPRTGSPAVSRRPTALLARETPEDSLGKPQSPFPDR